MPTTQSKYGRRFDEEFRREVAALASRPADAWEVSFMLEDFVLPDGTVVSDYGVSGTGHAFRVLGGVANGILDGAEKNQPQYLYWFAQGSRRQHLYDRMIAYLAMRGSPWRRLEVDPVTGMLSAPEAFWLTRGCDASRK